MQTESILSTLLSAAAFLKHTVQDVSSQSIRDAYTAAKSYLKKKLSSKPDAADALELATAKPESLMRKALLAEECEGMDFHSDAELIRLMESLASLVPPATEATRQIVRVNGDRNTVQVAGRDLIHTAKVIRRNAITPDERHLSVEQRQLVLALLREVAERLASTQGGSNYAAVHRLLQKRFQVASYLLIPRERYEEALSFLRQQRARHRGRLQACNLAAFQADLYRAVFAGARELGWDGARVYRFAGEKLGLKVPLASLKELGPVQLKSLVDCVQREVRLSRSRAVQPPATAA